MRKGEPVHSVPTAALSATPVFKGRAAPERDLPLRCYDVPGALDSLMIEQSPIKTRVLIPGPATPRIIRGILSGKILFRCD